MAYEDYIKAQKLGLKAFKSNTAKGVYPYLPVLDEILSMADLEGEVYLGVSDIPLDQVVGTSNVGRTQAFASNFMPLLKYGTEFSAKWSHLVDAQISEGIHDAIKVYEYMNRYYVVEGNKRVSVLKYLDCPTITAEVTRKIPKRTDDPENQLYYEFMDFYKITKINYLQFSNPGSYNRLLEAIGKTDGMPFTDDEYKDFTSFHAGFQKAYWEKGGKNLTNITCGDALLFFLSLYPYEQCREMTGAKIREQLDKIWTEILPLGTDDNVSLLMDPTEETRIVRSMLNIIKPIKRKTVAFVYDKDPAISPWTYGHELGRLHLDEVFADAIETQAFITDDTDEEADALLQAICESGYDIIFTVTPRLIKACLKVAATFPGVKILNCSLNSSHTTVRTYYTRMYEAKFLTGMVAGAMCENGKIGYVADYPIYGIAANINAFALGAQMVNPRVKIYLAWSTMQDFDIDRYFAGEGITYISSKDMVSPLGDDRQFGLYKQTGDTKVNLAMSIYHWGAFYEELINTILRGSWQVEESGDTRALNYWWGLSAGVIDVLCSDNLPPSTAKLIDLMKRAISTGNFHPFAGQIMDQDANIRCGQTELLKPEEIMNMNWLSENVVGHIPSLEELIPEARPVVQLRGLNTVVDKGGTSLV